MSDWKLTVKTALQFLQNSYDVSHQCAIDGLNWLIAISQDEKVKNILQAIITEIEDYADSYDGGDSVNLMMQQTIDYLDGKNGTIEVEHEYHKPVEEKAKSTISIV